MFGREANLPIGVDVGTSSVKMVRMKKDAHGYVALGAAQARIARIMSGEPNAEAETDSVVAAIRDCYRHLGSPTHQVVCGVSGPQLAVREFRFPRLPVDELGPVVRLEAEQASHLDINHSVLDFQITNDDPGDESSEEVVGVFALADSSLVESTLSLIRRASLHAVLMDIDDLALLNCLWECEPPNAEHSVCVVDVGATYTNVAILGHEGAPCVRDLPYGSDRLTEEMVALRGVSAPAVEAMLKGGDPGEEDKELQGALAASCTRIMTGIGSTLRYYRATGAVAPFERIHLCGGLAQVPAFVELLRHSLPVPVTPWSPFEKIRIAKDAVGAALLENSGPMMALATGLAMRSL